MNAYKKCKDSRLGFAHYLCVRSPKVSPGYKKNLFFLIFKKIINKFFIMSEMYFVIFEIIKKSSQEKNVFSASGWFIRSLSTLSRHCSSLFSIVCHCLSLFVIVPQRSFDEHGQKIEYYGKYRLQMNLNWSNDITS